jgi:two-component system chemotaxis response regulator CheB
MFRVLVAEDSATARELLVAILRSDPELQVVGEASDGAEAVALAQRLRPDVVTMDIRMPRMDGFAATKEIMITIPTPIVIVTGSTKAREVEVAMHALRAGALAVLHKPRGPEAPAFEEAARQLVATVKAMAQVKVVRHWRPAPTRPGGTPPRAASATQRGRLVAIATSTGGPGALQGLLSGLPVDFSAPILVVQHITAGFTPGLASWLNSVCGLQVKVAEHGEALAPHTVYLAPDDRHLGVSPTATLLLSSAPPIGGFRPSGTFLFESAARAFGAAAIALILTGMGEDGVEGLRAVRQAGGRILAQDEESSVVFGMPGAAIAAGLADLVLPPEALASRLVELVVQ